MPIYYPSRDVGSSEKLERTINGFLKSIGSTMKVTRKYIEQLQISNLVLPLDEPQFLTQVDDEKGVIENLAPEMIFATRGKLGVLLHDQEQLSEVVSEVLQSQPTMVLMDYKLLNNITGVDVTKSLLKEESSLQILGFSSNEERRNEFLDAGAVGFVHKRPTQLTETIAALIEEFGRISKL